ncbi:hypothetical protein ANS017_13220 [Paraclostridium bifermentans]|uniref:hypothetical protein n=1 Tax=Paraclostridium bifermentans TaxID=1490 RepID=UPI0021C49385|nr:hypothetical protein [Paraclostridium bifermentans]GKZ02634.1 hypothetical protein ANS014_10680 [Paraclostridium bifermentans]GKZ07403.1 hypothetical protein ANS015_22860 [Paraclostridium bifermentans]GKZ09938.1 hypothetical protein ANS017_13220 [Paraclostridium bifermentans]
MENRKRKYFDRDDFYDWGTDHDIMKAYEWLGSESRIFDAMLRNKPKLEVEVDEVFKSMMDEYVEKINFNMEERLLKMIYLNFYIVADECLGRIYKAICMYNSSVVATNKIRLEYKDAINCEDKNDITELFVDNILDQALTGITSKLKEINKICKNSYEFEIDKEFIDKVEVFRVERNLLVHSNGIVNKKNIKELMKIHPNTKIGDEVEYTSEKIEELLKLFDIHIWNLYEKIRDFYDPSSYYDELSDEEDDE